jgi:hypothetical protein
MINRTATLSALLLVFFLGAAFAQDVPTPRVTEADFATFVKLRYAVELAQAKTQVARNDPAKLASVKEELDGAFRDAGWSRDRFAEISEALLGASNRLSTLGSSDTEEAGYAQEELARMDPVTVATARAHAAELNDSSEESGKAMREARDDAQKELRGPAPTTAELQGRWAFNLDATVELNTKGLGADTKRKMRDGMARTMTSAMYLFGPGNAVEVLTRTAEGQMRSDKTTFRIAEGRIFFVAGKSEVSLDIGMKDGRLLIGIMGIYSIFDKAP